MRINKYLSAQYLSTDALRYIPVIRYLDVENIDAVIHNVTVFFFCGKADFFLVIMSDWKHLHDLLVKKRE